MLRASFLGDALLCLIAVHVAAAAPQIEVGFARLHEERVLMFEHLNGIKDGFFVDIGAFHPIDRSNTLSLKSMGWKGINVQGNPEQIKFFEGFASEDLTLNFAVGPVENEYLNMILHKLPPLSTGSEKVYKMNKQMSASAKEAPRVPVATIGLGELCRRFFYRKPTLLNIDVEGMGEYALMQNDWTTGKCRPELILIESNQWNKAEGLGNIKDLLTQHEYRQMNVIGEDVLFVASEVYEQYHSVYEHNKELIEKEEVVVINFNRTVSEAAPYFPSNSDLGRMQYNLFNSSVFLHFAVKGDNLDLSYLSRYSDRVACKESLKGRPMLIYNFDPRNCSVVLPWTYAVDRLEVSAGNAYYHIQFIRNNKKLDAYIFDHQYLQGGQLRIVRTEIKYGIEQPQPEQQPQPEEQADEYSQTPAEAEEEVQQIQSGTETQQIESEQQRTIPEQNTTERGQNIETNQLRGKQVIITLSPDTIYLAIIVVFLLLVVAARQLLSRLHPNSSRNKKKARARAIRTTRVETSVHDDEVAELGNRD